VTSLKYLNILPKKTMDKTTIDETKNISYKRRKIRRLK
jgi:hypothetical protein